MIHSTVHSDRPNPRPETEMIAERDPPHRGGGAYPRLWHPMKGCHIIQTPTRRPSVAFSVLRNIFHNGDPMLRRIVADRKETVIVSDLVQDNHGLDLHCGKCMRTFVTKGHFLLTTFQAMKNGKRCEARTTVMVTSLR